MARTSSQLTPIVQTSTPALIADRLREAIANGEFAQGEQLAETALALTFGVSRGPLREAMQRLTQEGLLVARRNRGLFVVELGPAEIHDIYLAREALEGAAIQQIIDKRRGEEARVLLPIVSQLASQDVAAASEADMRFHVTLVALSQSPRLQTMHGTLITQIRLCLQQMADSYTPANDRVAEHAAIVEAIIAEDLPTARTLLGEHMQDGLRRLTARRT